MTKVQAWAAHKSKEPFQPFTYELGALRPDEVDVDVDFCGLCHSDYSVWVNEWGNSQYPYVGGHEIVGRVRAMGDAVEGLKVGQRVGIGWYSRSNPNAPECLAGDHNLAADNEATIIGRYGGFADCVRVQSMWAIPLPDDLDVESAGPLFCGGITVFNPLVQNNIKPTDKVGVIGIGGLGHLALQFANKWGCEVTAFTSTGQKEKEARTFGAHHILDSRDPDSWKGASRKFDMILSTVAVNMNWPALMETLAPKGKLHLVGVAPDPVAIHAFQVIGTQRAFTGSPTGSPSTIHSMLEFCVRHKITAKTELFNMSDINAAMDHLEAGKARYRVVLKNDF